ncbi:MAG: fibronectin [Candidatus Marinimicrobia bacterium]|nr:fibronectin [Candidatus Neomarinimicrobiota bacterium]
MKKRVRVLILFMMVFFSAAIADQTKWIAIGSLHNWYSSAGCEIEVGRTHQVSDQQDGLRWPALYRWQDMQAAKALWIGTTDYDDPISGQHYNYKVVHVGPRGLDENNEFMPVEFKMIGRFQAPVVVVDGLLASHTVYMDEVDEVDPNLFCDRMIFNVVNTSIGITVTRKIYAWSQQYNDNYFIYEYVFKNTGIIDKEGTVVEKTLKDVIFFFQYRYAICREVGPYGLYYLPQSTSWGHNTINHAIYYHPDFPFNAIFAWHGRHSKCKFDNIGGPHYTGDGHLGASQFPGVVVLWADKSAKEHVNDYNQPFSTPKLGSDEDITKPNDQFNPAMMTKEYAVMSSGRPSMTHAEEANYVPIFDPATQSLTMDPLKGDPGDLSPEATPGGFSQCMGFGPYTLEPGDSVRIVLAEGANGISRKLCYEIGKKWLTGSGPFELPDGSTTNNADEFKNAWVYTGIDSLLMTFRRAKENFDNNYNIPLGPPPPESFEVISGGDRITLGWKAEAAQNYDYFAGFRVYRAIHKPDTTFDLIFECGQGTDHPEVVTEFVDKSPVRGFNYYYYVTTFSNGGDNVVEPGRPMESNLFWTRTIEPAFLRRPPGRKLEDIRIVPNPYNVKAREIQFGEGAPDRIMFYELPPVCDIKIYTERGDLIKVIHHTDGSGDEEWNCNTMYRQVVVSGIYLAYIEVTQDYHDPETGELIYRKGDSIVKKLIVIR